VNKQTGQDFSHRRAWIENRILMLGGIFAIEIMSYAVMNNHYHIVFYVNQALSESWDDKEVKTRWAALFAQDASEHEHLTGKQLKDKICVWRQRLMDISWFMKCLNQPIALLCNLEDKCKGHFWESRYKSQALLDEAAVMCAMAYTDLNPIRAKMANSPETSEFTSIYHRIKALKQAKAEGTELTDQNIDSSKQPAELMPFEQDADNKPSLFSAKIEFKLSDYLALVDTTGRILREGKKGAIPESLAPILHRLNLSPSGWLGMVENLEDSFFTAIGNETKLIHFRAKYNKLPRAKGLKSARRYYLKAA
jgi:REP element-mobilizing transposase RayT